MTCGDEIVAKMEEIRSHCEGENLRWATRTWLRKFFKAHNDGMRLSNTGSHVLDELQSFLFRALRHGLVVKIVHNPFVQLREAPVRSQDIPERSVEAPQSRGQQPEQAGSRGVASTRAQRPGSQPGVRPTSMERPVGQPTSYGPEGPERHILVP